MLCAHVCGVGEQRFGRRLSLRRLMSRQHGSRLD
jgi:hypothetical protein